jgi:putative salt-induced outer membrane protein YdiY
VAALYAPLGFDKTDTLTTINLVYELKQVGL